MIGGGDFSEDRLVPDMIRAELSGDPLILRNPGATRPWQHVLDCLSGYLSYLEALATDISAPRAMNFGPQDPKDVMTVADVQKSFAEAIGGKSDWQHDDEDQPHEMAALAIDSSKARQNLGWTGRLTSAEAVRWSASWYGQWKEGADAMALTRDQIGRG